MKRKTKRKLYTEPPCDDERIKFEKAFNTWGSSAPLTITLGTMRQVRESCQT